MAMRDWIDHHGVTRRAPTIRGRLKFYIPLHAALRAFVFTRDGFRCRHCGVTPIVVPAAYDGRETVGTPIGHCLVMDHVVSRRNGGEHHPDNLQTLCDSCNARKAGLVDARRAA